MKPLTYDQALYKAAALCSVGEKAPQDIYQKLLGWGISEPDAARMMAYLTQENYLSEERFAKAFVNDKFRFEHWGRIKIAYALRGKGIEDRYVSLALEEKIDPEEYLETCRDLLAAKMRGMEQPLSQNDRARLYRFASQRGFESNIIGRALSLCGSDVLED